MKTRCRLAIAVSVFSVWVLGGATAARAQGSSSILAAMAAAYGDLIDQELSVPSLGGPTGIVSVPNAITIPAGTWQVALGYQGMRASASGVWEDHDDFGAWSVQTTHRLSDTGEAWASYSCTTNHPASHAWALGGKKMFTRLARIIHESW